MAVASKRATAAQTTRQSKFIFCRPCSLRFSQLKWACGGPRSLWVAYRSPALAAQRRFYSAGAAGGLRDQVQTAWSGMLRQSSAVDTASVAESSQPSWFAGCAQPPRAADAGSARRDDRRWLRAWSPVGIVSFTAT
jgi:hypothetical protein